MTPIRKRPRALFSVLFILLLIAACGDRAATIPSAPPNFGVVVDKGIYRGGQPSAGEIEYLHNLGVRTILKLNDQQLADEQRAADRLGIRLVAIPFDAKTIGNADTCASVARALAVLEDKSNWPVYVHCSKGRDRGGYIVGVYRETAQGWDWKAVDRELIKYGHTGNTRLAFPQISSELSRGIPSCASEIAKLRNPAR